MKNTQNQSRPFIAIVLALIVGFTAGVIVAVYTVPSILPKIPQTQQNGPTTQEIEKHIKHMEAEVAKCQNVDKPRQCLLRFRNNREGHQCLSQSTRPVSG
jgi:hypothetical protein